MIPYFTKFFIYSFLQGNPVGDMKVTLDSADASLDGTNLAIDKAMTKSADGYTIELMSMKPEAGFYDLVVSAKPAKADPKLVGNTGVKLTVKVLTEQKISKPELRIIDGETGTKSNKLTYPQTTNGLSVRQKDRLQLSFSVLSTATNQPMTVHQAFVKVNHI